MPKWYNLSLLFKYPIVLDYQLFLAQLPFVYFFSRPRWFSFFAEASAIKLKTNEVYRNRISITLQEYLLKFQVHISKIFAWT